MSVVKFTETVFKDQDKKGILAPDEDGYYTLPVGALNSYNSAGEYYTAQGAIDLFQQSSQLMRRIKNGALFSELGHPKRLPGMSLDDYYCRIISIEETNVCGHFSEISLDTEYGRKNPHLGAPNMIAMIGKVTPMGVKASALKSSLENPKINTAFSIRALCDMEMVGGKRIRKLTNVITYDMVLEGGISIANKSHSTALESMSEDQYESSRSGLVELTDTLIDKSVLRKVLTNTSDMLSMEGSEELFHDLLRSIEVRDTRRNRLAEW